MTELTGYAVGWQDKACLEAAATIKPYWPDISEELLSNSLRSFDAVFNTPEAAQGCLDYICSINSENNLKVINGVGSAGFFVVKVKGNQLVKYECDSPIIPIPFPYSLPMNRSVVIVKYPTKKREYGLIRIHWNYGQTLVDWLREQYNTWDRAYDLICQGHRISIEELSQYHEHEVFKTLKEAEAWCEHSTLAYYDGKRWKFKGEV